MIHPRSVRAALPVDRRRYEANARSAGELLTLLPRRVAENPSADRNRDDA